MQYKSEMIRQSEKQRLSDPYGINPYNHQFPDPDKNPEKWKKAAGRIDRLKALSLSAPLEQIQSVEKMRQKNYAKYLQLSLSPKKTTEIITSQESESSRRTTKDVQALRYDVLQAICIAIEQAFHEQTLYLDRVEELWNSDEISDKYHSFTLSTLDNNKERFDYLIAKVLGRYQES